MKLILTVAFLAIAITPTVTARKVGIIQMTQ